MSNPFECTCSLAWLKETLKASNLVAGNPKCSVPLHLRDQSISSLDDTMFKCFNLSSEYECPGSQSEMKLSSNFDDLIPSAETTIMTTTVSDASSCPKNCSCPANGIVRCSHASLTRVPVDIPLRVREL